jgi:hypothetical protein
MKKNTQQNYINKIPVPRQDLVWEQNDKNIVTLQLENKGFANFLAQKLLKKPKISYIHLDEFGSFVWLQINGTRDISAIGELIRERFGEKAEPLYERLTQYFKTLEHYGFITFLN